MAAEVIDGKAIAAAVRAEVGVEVERLRGLGLVPGLTVVLVGEDPASMVYTRQKEKVAGELGMKSDLLRLPPTVTEAELLQVIAGLNQDDSVHGILVQSPLPDHIDEQRIYAAISPAKDVDGFHPANVGCLWLGQDGLFPCTPVGVMEMLRRSGVNPHGRRAVVVGRSNIVGKPLAALLIRAHATVTVCHSRTADLAAVCREAEILVAALGKMHFIGPEHVGPGATVIDVGIHVVPGTKNKLAGDVDYARVAEIAGRITPVPGGVGPMTIAILMQNTVKAAKSIRGIRE